MRCWTTRVSCTVWGSAVPHPRRPWARCPPAGPARASRRRGEGSMGERCPPITETTGMARHHRERHRTGRIGWLRAAVLGANDGIVSTASLGLGVAAAQASHSNVVVAGVAGLVAGAMSMAAGEYVSVQSQADTEQAELARERMELRTDTQGEHEGLMASYVERGLDPVLAKQVADQLMAHDAI